jgi:hypothetical protein
MTGAFDTPQAIFLVSAIDVTKSPTNSPALVDALSGATHDFLYRSPTKFFTRFSAHLSEKFLPPHTLSIALSNNQNVFLYQNLPALNRLSGIPQTVHAAKSVTSLGTICPHIAVCISHFF